MDTTIEQQVAMDESLVPHAQWLRIGRSNFFLLLDIKSKESTLQLVYDVLRICPFFKAFLVTADVLEIYMQEFWATTNVHHHAIRFKMDNKKHIVNLESFRDMLHICLRVHGQTFAELPFKEEILDFIRFLRHSAAIRTLIDVNIDKLYQSWRSFAAIINKCLTGKSSGYDSLRLSQAQILWGLYHKRNVDYAYLMNSNAYKEYSTIVTKAAPPKPKANVRKTRGSSDTSITPPTVTAGPRLTASAKGKQPAKASKAKSLSSLSKDGDDEGDDDEEDEGDDDVNQEVKKDDDKESGDDEEGGDDKQGYDEEASDEEAREEESFNPFPKTPENSEGEGNGEEELGLNGSREEGHVEEEEEDELYRDVNINQGRGIQATLEVEDSHVTLTLVNPDGHQQSSLVLSQFVTSMLNPKLDAVKMAVQIQSDRLRDATQRENDEFLRTINENIKKIIKKQVKEQVQVQVSKILPRIEETVNEQLEAKVLTRSSQSLRTSYAVAADLSEMELKKILIEKMEGIKRRDDDADKNEEPFARPDRGASASESAFAEEPMQTTFQMDEPTHPKFDTGADDQPIVQSSQHPEWFPQQQKPPNPDRDWNKTLSATHGSIQPWISELAKRTDSRFSFDELMDTRLDFSNFLMNRLRVDTLTPQLLAGPTYELTKGSCKSMVELEYHLEEVYKSIIYQLDWVKPEGQRYPHNLLKPLPLIPNNQGRHVIPFEHFINNDLEYLRGGALSRKYTTSVTKIKAADYGHRRVEDLQLGVESYQKKLNLTRPDSYCTNLKRKETYIAYSNPRGFIYQNKDKRNRLMRIDELHKFNDGTLNVRTALDDRLKGINMQYLPTSIWRKSDKDRAATMIQAIDKMLKTRRIMRSLESFV
uniref:Uncharacterized protein n=1 Tax=Tanacetum cinerariifolium TaxID=118510 RepID=A0A6L2LSJ7_TANCI|nr:hypothetical protein [Tanacetum cinerariifolium]